MKNAKDIAEAAQEAFWAKVVELVPEAGTGDFDPLVAVNFDRDCEAAVEHWLECNVPRRRKKKEPTHRAVLETADLNDPGFQELLKTFRIRARVLKEDPDVPNYQMVEYLGTREALEEMLREAFFTKDPEFDQDLMSEIEELVPPGAVGADAYGLKFVGPCEGKEELAEDLGVGVAAMRACDAFLETRFGDWERYRDLWNKAWDALEEYGGLRDAREQGR